MYLKTSNPPLQAINTKPQSLSYRILHHLTKEVEAHLDRKCLAVLFETSSLQLYTYFSRHFAGCIQARFHRTLQVPALEYRCCGSELTEDLLFRFGLPSTVPQTSLWATVTVQLGCLFSFGINHQREPVAGRKPHVALFRDAITKSDQTNRHLG